MYASFLQSDIVECPPGIAETLVEVDSNVPRSASGNSFVGAAGGMRASVGVCRNVCDEEGESDDWYRKQETHAGKECRAG